MNDDTTIVPEAEPAAADTPVEGTDNSASVQVEEAPEAAPAQSSADANATDTAEKLFAGKYKTVEELEKSYQELNSTYSRTTQEKAELSRILADAFATPTPQAQAPVDEFDSYADPQPSKPDDTVVRKLALMEFAMGHPDANGDSMVKILQNSPEVAEIGSYEAKLKYAYALSKMENSGKAVEAAKKQAEVDTKVKIAEKQAAQVESVTKQSAPPDTNQPLSPQEMRSTIRDTNAFDELLKKQFPGIGTMMK